MAKYLVEQTESLIKKYFNPKACVIKSDRRCGNRYAVVTYDEEERPKFWTDFMPINMLNEVLRMLVNYDSFIKIKEA